MDVEIHQDSHKGEDLARNISTLMIEFWPNQFLSRIQAIRQLSYNIREDLKKFVTKTIVGEIPLEEYAKSHSVMTRVIQNLHQTQDN